MAKFYAKYQLVYIQVEKTPLIMAINNPGIKVPLYKEYHAKFYTRGGFTLK